MSGDLGLYPTLFAVALARAAVVCAVAFVAIPRLVWARPVGGANAGSRLWGDVALGLSAASVVAVALCALGAFDVVALVLVTVAGLLAAVASSSADGWGQAGIARYVRALDALDGTRGAAWRWPSLSPARVGWGAAIGVVALAGAVRTLVPVWGRPGLLALEHYDALEVMKALEAGDLVSGVVGYGHYALALVLSELTRVDDVVALMTTGALAAAAASFGIYRMAIYYGLGRPGALAGAALVALGGAAVPTSGGVREAPVLLAAALAAAAFPHAVAALGGGRRAAAVAGASLLACLLVHPGAGALLATALAAVVVVGLPRRRRIRGGLACAAVVAASWAFWVASQALGRSLPSGLIEPLRVGSEPPWPMAAVATAVALTAAAAAVAVARRQTVGVVAAAALSGLLALWVQGGGGPTAPPVALLTVALGLAAAVVADGVWAGVSALARRARPAVRWSTRARAGAWAPPLAAAALVAASTAAPPPPTPPVEPPGFVRAYHAVSAVAPPTTWTAVSHLGTGILARNQAPFIPYDAFAALYDPATYDHTGPGAVPTPDLFVFVEDDPLRSAVADELLPADPEAAARALDWCRRYLARPNPPVPMTLFYDGGGVRVYRLSRPAPTLFGRPQAPSAL